MKDKNALVAAETGCGKTLAYLLPLFHSIFEDSESKLRRRTVSNSPSAIILAPTRELVDQIFVRVFSYL